MSESDAGSSGRSSTIRTGGGRGRPASPSGGSWGPGGAEQDPGPRWEGRPRAAEHNVGWGRAWLAGKGRERWGPLTRQVDEWWWWGVMPGSEGARLGEEEGAGSSTRRGPVAAEVCPRAG